MQKKHAKLGLAALAVTALVVGLSVGLTQKNKTSTAAAALEKGNYAAIDEECYEPVVPPASKSGKASSSMSMGTSKSSKSGGEATSGAAGRRLVVPGTEEYVGQFQTGKRRKLREEIVRDLEDERDEDEDEDDCSCAPSEYTFKLDLSNFCQADTLTGASPGIAAFLCAVASGTPDDIDTMPALQEIMASMQDVSTASFGEIASMEEGGGGISPEDIQVYSIQFTEVNAAGEVINQETQTGSFGDRDTVSFTSISGNLDPSLPIEDQGNLLPKFVDVVLLGRYTNPTTGEIRELANEVVWEYTNACDVQPIEDGDKIGWLTFSELEPASADFCSAVTSSPTSSPTSNPTGSPTPIPTAPTVTSPTVAPTFGSKSSKYSMSLSGSATSKDYSMSLGSKSAKPYSDTAALDFTMTTSSFGDNPISKKSCPSPVDICGSKASKGSDGSKSSKSTGEVDANGGGSKSSKSESSPAPNVCDYTPSPTSVGSKSGKSSKSSTPEPTPEPTKDPIQDPPTPCVCEEQPWVLTGGACARGCEVTCLAEGPPCPTYDTKAECCEDLGKTECGNDLCIGDVPTPEPTKNPAPEPPTPCVCEEQPWVLTGGACARGCEVTCLAEGPPCPTYGTESLCCEEAMADSSQCGNDLCINGELPEDPTAAPEPTPAPITPEPTFSPTEGDTTTVNTESYSDPTTPPRPSPSKRPSPSNDGFRLAPFP